MNKNFWVERYKALKSNGIVGSMSYGDEFQERVDNYFNSIKGHLTKIKCKVLVDFGCGTGKYYRLLKDFFSPKKYIGIDIIDFVIEDNNKKFNTDEFVCKKTIAGFPQKVDVIWAASILQHIDDKQLEKILSVFYDSLTDKGRFYMINCTLPSGTDVNTVYRSYEKQISLCEKAGFKCKMVHEINGVGLFECLK